MRPELRKRVFGSELSGDSRGVSRYSNGELADGDAYGQELILDMHDCDSAKFTREKIDGFCERLCEFIDMERCDIHYWDDYGVPSEEQQTNPKTKGTSAVQFILTSTIVIHTLDILSKVYVNVFSCKAFDAEGAAAVAADWFGSKAWTARLVTRQ